MVPQCYMSLCACVYIVFRNRVTLITAAHYASYFAMICHLKKENTLYNLNLLNCSKVREFSNNSIEAGISASGEQ